ncbi:type II toxin-antitoxin system RelE/ParE family toxin [Massilia sp. R2A-15]|uniref:type II toxin-antitoxin system RelE/ParE family toxin n=1 Tax=Massilia sp. R2A-15 TaxID=3064278 RepID=UPI0035A6E604
MLAIRLKDKSFFIYGYAKNQRDNINETELRALKALASQLLNYDAKTLAVALNAGELVEINHEET